MRPVASQARVGRGRQGRWRRRLAHLAGWEGNPHHLLPMGGGAMAPLHRLAARATLAGALGRWAWAGRLALTLGWPLRLTWQARAMLGRFGPEVRARFGISLARQAATLAWLGIGYGLPPRAAYRHRLFLREERARIGDILFDHEARALFPWLNGLRDDPVVADKHAFATACATAGLPAVPTLAWGGGGALGGVVEDWGAGDLVAKPTRGARGEGVTLWRRTAPGCYRSGGATLDRDALLARLAADAGGWLLQRALVNSAEVADLSPGALVTVRVMTARQGGHCTAFAALLMMPFGQRFANNHGIGCAVDLTTGMLGAACGHRPLGPAFDAHPDTGAAITGRTLPGWVEIRDLATRAHAALSDARLLGWDVAPTPAGPVLLETNAGWDVTLPQIAIAPLGRLGLPALL